TLVQKFQSSKIKKSSKSKTNFTTNLSWIDISNLELLFDLTTKVAQLREELWFDLTVEVTRSSGLNSKSPNSFPVASGSDSSGASSCFLAGAGSFATESQMNREATGSTTLKTRTRR
ncbi:hypothetical protein U1Q18_037573, partial [Sarracenia purpurea var. burkii]